MTFDLARQIADTVLYEGYVLYPYRASAAKNQVRWQFGVLAPPAYAARGNGERSANRTECLVEPGDAAVLELRVRFLQVQARSVEERVGDRGFRPVESLTVEGRDLVTWDEGIPREWDAPRVPLADVLDAERSFALDVPGGREEEMLQDAAGTVRGRVVRERWPIAGRVGISAERAGSLLRVRVRVENATAWTDGGGADRNVALRQSLVSLHSLLAVRAGAFVSLLEPPALAQEAAAACVNQHTWPVLVGPPGARDVMLSSPIILYDYPIVAPESPGDLCDATEIDEILMLRVMTMTDAEKREARATDDRARQIVERSDSLPPEVFERLHGALRSVAPAPRDAWEAFLNPPSTPGPDEAWVEVGGARLAKGSRVRLQPKRRADSMDFFLQGKTGRVAGVHRDLEDQAYLAVTVDDDPAADLHGWYGRFFYFHADEVEPLASGHGPVHQDEPDVTR